MTTTELIQLLKQHEKNRAGKSRKIVISAQIDEEEKVVMHEDNKMSIEIMNDEFIELFASNEE